MDNLLLAETAQRELIAEVNAYNWPERKKLAFTQKAQNVLDFLTNLKELVEQHEADKKPAVKSAKPKKEKAEKGTGKKTKAPEASEAVTTADKTEVTAA